MASGSGGAHPLCAASWRKVDPTFDKKVMRASAFFRWGPTVFRFCAGLAALILWIGQPARGAGFSDEWLQDAYWKDGKAEFNFYEARIVRYGQLRDCEVIHILVREDFAPETPVKADDWKRPGVYPVLKLNQILQVPTGIYVYQQMHSAFWRIGDGRLVKQSLTSNDSCGNTFKLFERAGDAWNYHFHTYWESMSEGTERFDAPADGIFYDELPARVRSIDFAAAARGSFPIALAPTIIQSKKGSVAFAPASVEYAPDVDAARIAVTVAHAGGKDTFLLDAAPPHRLLEWRMADGGSLRLKRSLKIDYWNYNRPGDKERALAAP
jgi:hypothetical protein